MFRLGLLATLSATILTGCVSSYGYRADQGGDYYYAEPSVDYYYDGYGTPYGSIGYGSQGGWYGSFGYGFGYTPYSRYGFPYSYGGYPYGYPYSYYPYPHRRPNHHHRPPNTVPPGTPPPGVIVDPPGSGPRVGDREDGPWRRPREDGRRPPYATPQPAIPGSAPRPGVVVGENAPVRRRIMLPQPGLPGGNGQPGGAMQNRRAPVSMPQSDSPPRPRYQAPPSAPAPERRIDRPERESRRDPTP